jgi:hypothetical protein
MNKNLWLKRIRNICGFLGMILPWISLLGAYLAYKNGADVNWKDLSISQTYYFTPALASILTAASIVLITYDGYEFKDNLITTISGVFGICIVLFPCSGVLNGNVGYFQIPIKISSKLHCISAVIFFGLLAINSFFLFTLGENKPTKEKKIRNLIYRICGIGMIGSFLLMLIPHFFAQTFIVEAIALTFFGVSWLVKGQALGILKDKN